MVHQERVLRARVRLMSLDRRLLRGAEGIAVYRTLAEVSPQVYASKLARVLVDESKAGKLAGAPELRRALLLEAREWAGRIEVGHPFRARVMELLAEAEQREGMTG
ncbi:hypothetical protein ACIRBX_11795 [Kitasatospora sp. NPDC096147]|uniref:hypothetical protein n=1 Tax=Kitasatospora sp. NPDC096147 TaxID=3364093 RepID=UPI0037F66436